MKKKYLILFALPLSIWACNNEAKDSVEKADSMNEAKMDSPSTKAVITTDAETSEFLVKAANGGMAEVQFGDLALQKASSQQVKDFGQMMKDDHSAVNEQVKALAAQRNVTLPATISEDMRKHQDELAKKSGKDFDKEYVDMMVKDHQEDIKVFESAADKTNDAEVKTFINNTLPKLRSHLESIKTIQKTMK